MSSSVTLGFIFGLLSAVFFALYMVPQKITRVNTTAYIWVMSLGVLAGAVGCWAVAGFPSFGTWGSRIDGLLCGVGWALGTTFFSAAIRRIGLSLATPIKNTTAVLGTLVGLVVLQEWRTTDPQLSALGSLLIVAAAILIGYTGDADVPLKQTWKGILYALAAALAYASYLVPLKRALATIGYWAFTPWMALGITVTATVVLLAQPGGLRSLNAWSLRSHSLSLLGGLAWVTAFLCLAASINLSGLAIAWPLSNLNTLPAVALGLLVFREVDMRKQWPKLLIGLGAALVGTVLLGMARSR
jgi:glucose uptake protein GlcU